MVSALLYVCVCVCVRERERERDRDKRLQYVQYKEELCVCLLVSVKLTGKWVFLSPPVNTKNFFLFFFLFYRTNKQRYLQQKHGSTGLVCLCPPKDINLDKRFTVLVTTWERVSGLRIWSEHESLNEKIYPRFDCFSLLAWHLIKSSFAKACCVMFTILVY